MGLGKKEVESSSRPRNRPPEDRWNQWKRDTIMTKRLILALLLSCSPLWATTYYVDNCVTVGNDRNNGTSTSTPWLTVAHLKGQTFYPNDSVLFRSGCTWHEQLSLIWGGTAARPITFGNYGAGPLPLFDAADPQSTWTSEADDGFTIYFSPTSSYTSNPLQVFQIDGSTVTRLTVESSKASMTTGTWYYDSANTRIYIRTTADDLPSNHVIEASARAEGVNNPAVHQNYQVINGLAATRAKSFGFSLSGTTGVIIENCASSYNYDYGFELNGSTNMLLEDSSSFYNGASGVDFEGGETSGFLITGNVIHHNCQLNIDANQQYCGGIRGGSSTSATAWSGTISNNLIYSQASGGAGVGIHIDTNPTSASVVTVEYNELHDNYGSGIKLEALSNGIVQYNVSYNNAGAATSAGVEIYRSYYNRIFNNTVWGNSEGLRSYGDGTGLHQVGNVFQNNISVNSSGPNLAAAYGGSNDGVNGSGNIYKYNCFGPAASDFIYLGGGVYESTYAAWETSSGNCGTVGCSYSVQADPQFVNAAKVNFALSSTSPAINAGTNLGSPYNIGLMPGSTWPNSVVTGDQNAYGSGWEIGAFIYVAPVAPASKLQVVKVN
jgi:hypothetical protein